VAPDTLYAYNSAVVMHCSPVSSLLKLKGMLCMLSVNGLAITPQPLVIRMTWVKVMKTGNLQKHLRHPAETVARYVDPTCSHCRRLNSQHKFHARSTVTQQVLFSLHGQNRYLSN
jgi:hypothetical protein